MNTPSYTRHRFPSPIISYAFWLYHRFSLSFRDVEGLLAERGIAVSYESVRYWCRKFGTVYARRLRNKEGRLGDTWHLDELFVTIRGERDYLWRAADQDGDTIDILLQNRRDRQAAKRFFRKLLKAHKDLVSTGLSPTSWEATAAHRELIPTIPHATGQYENNRVEVSHQPTRQRERQMRRFKSVGQAQRFLSIHAAVQNLFRVGRHLLRSCHHRLLRDRAFECWQQVTSIS